MGAHLPKLLVPYKFLWELEFWHKHAPLTPTRIHTDDRDKTYYVYLLPRLIEIGNRNCWWDKVNWQLNFRYFRWILYTAC